MTYIILKDRGQLRKSLRRHNSPAVQPSSPMLVAKHPIEEETSLILQGAFYRLMQAPWAWYDRIEGFLTERKVIRHSGDVALNVCNKRLWE